MGGQHNYHNNQDLNGLHVYIFNMPLLLKLRVFLNLTYCTSVLSKEQQRGKHILIKTTLQIDFI